MNLQIKKLNKKVVIIGVILFLSVLLLVSLFFLKIFKQKLPVVQVVPVVEQELVMEIKTDGVLQCVQQQDFYARTTSSVKEIRKSEGTRVTLGEAVLLLDNTNVLRELGRAENALAILQNDYLQAVSNKVYFMNKRDEARKKQEWLEELYKLEEVPYTEIEEIRREIADWENQIKSINLNTLENQVNKGSLAVQAAREELAETVVLSPFEGTVLQMAVKHGEPISKGDFLFSVGKTDVLEVEAFVNEYDVIKIEQGDQVEIYSEALAEKIYQGQVEQIAPLAEVQQTPTGPASKVKLKIALLAKAAEFKPGFTVKVRIPLETKTEAIVIPVTALKEIDEQSFVYVYENGLVQKRIIKQGVTTEKELEVITGLAAGELVVVDSMVELSEQMKVKAHDYPLEKVI